MDNSARFFVAEKVHTSKICARVGLAEAEKARERGGEERIDLDSLKNQRTKRLLRSDDDSSSGDSGSPAPRLRLCRGEGHARVGRGEGLHRLFLSSMREGR